MKANPIQTAVNAGEFSPRTDSRVDINQYANGAARLENYLVVPQGGMMQRPGTRYIATTSGVGVNIGTSSLLKNGKRQFGDGAAGRKNAGLKFTAQDTGTIQSVSTFIESVSTSLNALIGFYADSSGSPGAQVGGNSDTTNLNANGTRLFLWSSNAPTLTAGTDYWVVMTDDDAGSGLVQIRTVAGTSDYSSGFNDTLASITGNQPVNSDFYFGIKLSTDYLPPQLIPFSFNTEQSYIVEIGTEVIQLYTNQGVLSGAQNAPSITNGTFDSNITGWTDWSAGTGAISWASIRGDGTMRFSSSGSGNEAKARQAITIDAADTGKQHIVKFKFTYGSGEKLQIQISSSPGDAAIYANTQFTSGSHTIAFTPGATTFYIEFIKTGALDAYLNSVSFVGTTAFQVDSQYASEDLFNIQYAQSADILYLSSPSRHPHKLERRGPVEWSLTRLFPTDGPYLDKNVTATTATASATSGRVTVTFSSVEGINDGQGFTDDDVGRLFRQEHGADAGWGKIYSVISSTSVNVALESPLSASTANTLWWLGAWSVGNGHPGAVTLSGQRLVWGGTTYQPNTVWTSQSGDIENMRPDSYVSSALTVESDDAITFTLASTELNQIQWMTQNRSLIIGTSGGEWVVSSAGASITPADIDATRHTSMGSAKVQPVSVNNHLLFVQNDKKTVNNLKFSFENDSFVAEDLTLLADHIGSPATATDDFGFKQIAYQKEPDSIVWCARNDGQLCALTFKPGELVAGWSRHIIAGDGIVESVACIPGENGGGRTFDSGDRTELWMVVRRTINGSTALYVEMMEGYVKTDIKPAFGTNTFVAEDAFYVDSGLTYDGTSTSTLTGLDHLEGETVYVNGNGADLGSYTVTSGSITLSSAVTKAQVGLLAVPRYLSLKLNYGGRAGTSVGKKKRVFGMSFVLLDSYDFKFGDGNAENDSTLYHTVNIDVDDVGGIQPLYTGEVFKEFCGPWHRDPRISIRGDVGPLPTNFLALAPEIQTNDVK